MSDDRKKLPPKKLPPKKLPPKGGRYFASPNAVECIPSGCRLLDKVLGGGWGMGRIANIVGDTSTGKTLLSIEACANFALKYPDGIIRYRETEAAFDEGYARTVGLPTDRIEINPSYGRLSSDGKKKVETLETVDTVEEFYADLNAFLRKAQQRSAGLYILDSLDAIGDDAERAEAFGKDSYGAKKPKLMGQLFRRLTRKVEKSNVGVIIVSQVRDKIGVSFGEKHTRSGGRALDFYASQILWLSNLGQEVVTRNKVKRSVGIRIKAKCKKNKIALPFRDCEFLIKYAYGIDDFDTCLNWLADHDGLEQFQLTKSQLPAYLKSLDSMDRNQIREARRDMNKAVDIVWRQVEESFLPKRGKYA